MSTILTNIETLAPKVLRSQVVMIRGLFGTNHNPGFETIKLNSVGSLNKRVDNVIKYIKYADQPLRIYAHGAGGVTFLHAVSKMGIDNPLLKKIKTVAIVSSPVKGVDWLHHMIPSMCPLVYDLRKPGVEEQCVVGKKILQSLGIRVLTVVTESVPEYSFMSCLLGLVDIRSDGVVPIKNQSLGKCICKPCLRGGEFTWCPLCDTLYAPFSHNDILPNSCPLRNTASNFILNVLQEKQNISQLPKKSAKIDISSNSHLNVGLRYRGKEHHEDKGGKEVIATSHYPVLDDKIVHDGKYEDDCEHRDCLPIYKAPTTLLHNGESDNPLFNVGKYGVSQDYGLRKDYGLSTYRWRSGTTYQPIQQVPKPNFFSKNRLSIAPFSDSMIIAKSIAKLKML